MMDRLINELHNFLEIDKLALDDEIVKQPTLFFKVSEAFADAVAERDSAKEELATIDAELDGRARDRLHKKYNGNGNGKKGERVTEAMVKNEMQLEKDHGTAFDTYILAKTRADKLQALKEAFQQRGYMLRDLASLYVANYYGDSSVKGDSNTDSAAYRQTRERLASARGQRNR